MLQSPHIEKRLSSLGRLDRRFCEALGKQSSKSLLRGVLAVAGVCLVCYFIFVSRGEHVKIL